MAPVTLLIIGAGSRGTIYSEYARQHPDLAQVVGVAEPRDFFRGRMAEAFSIPSERVFWDWTSAAAKVRFADAVIIATGDREHVGPAEAFAKRGYAMLLEKPMSPAEEDCRRIVEAVQKAGILFAVCHVLRYTQHTRKVKEILDSGAIGEVISMQHLEPVGYWHQAHSFVRGNWRNQSQSSFMLLQKSCHDLDWMLYIMGRRCERVSSFGSLSHFRRESQPAGAADRCLDCGAEANCPYSAKKIYLNRVKEGFTGWPVDVITEDLTEKGVLEALRTGPYGRCVYRCDNDVVDHQVVNLEFAGGRTAAFTMTAFTEGDLHRNTRIFGTRRRPATAPPTRGRSPRGGNCGRTGTKSRWLIFLRIERA